MKRRRKKTDPDPCELPLLTVEQQAEMELLRPIWGDITERVYAMRLKNYSESRQYGRPQPAEIQIVSTAGVDLGGENQSLAFFQWNKGG